MDGDFFKSYFTRFNKSSNFCRILNEFDEDDFDSDFDVIEVVVMVFLAVMASGIEGKKIIGYLLLLLLVFFLVLVVVLERLSGSGGLTKFKEFIDPSYFCRSSPIIELMMMMIHPYPYV